jgi:hypothetical protein
LSERLRTCYLCIHGHFYQPPRVDPFSGQIHREPGAAPYANWNERITAECYAPNAAAGHFARISFNLGGTLASWMEEHAHATYAEIVASERGYHRTLGVANGLAQPVHHVILPLARRRDKICQVRWGLASFRHRFGHRPEGVWLPEMAVDMETLEILAAEGLRFTLLSDEQVRGDLVSRAGPYWVKLSDGQRIVIFVRDRELSNSLSFAMPDRAFIDQWIEEKMGWRCQLGGLWLVATDGETFGHHQPQGVTVLSHILDGGAGHGYNITTLGLHLAHNPPKAELEIVENTSWSCAHLIDRWVVGCTCTPGDSRWKGGLRRALDNLASDLDAIYVGEAAALGFDPWLLRDDYIAVVLGEIEGKAFLREQGGGHLTHQDTQRLLALLEAQFYRQRMYASCAFFFDDLDRLEPRYAIGNAVQALALTRYATGSNLTHSFHRDLLVARNRATGRTGADILDEILEKAQI